MRIDSHHHLWQYRPEEFQWVPDSMAQLRRDFLLADLVAELDAAEVDGTVLVQTGQTIGDTEWMLRQAADPAAAGRILGVVGWAPLAALDLPAQLERLAVDRRLKGLRHILQAEPDETFRASAFRHGLRHLQSTGLVFDLLVVERQLPLALEMVDAFPGQPFVLDHMGKPAVLHGDFAAWRTHFELLAQRPQVTCKLSGLVTEADPKIWTASQLAPYLEAALECFGAERLMIGTDWPVCTVGCRYRQWWDVVEWWTAPLSTAERAAILGGTAQRVYRLQAPGVGGQDR